METISFHTRLLRSKNGQFVCSLIPWFLRVTLHPQEFRRNAVEFSFPDFGQDCLDEILVQHVLFQGRLPIVSLPILGPHCYTVNAVFAIGNYLNVTIVGR